MKKIITATLLSAGITAGCSDIGRDSLPDIPPAGSDRLYILNEGKMGMNNASIDFYDFADGSYTSDAFPAANPDVALELGDTGNDIGIYDGKLWVVLNGSDLVEVMDAITMEHIGTVDIPSGRDITFSGGCAYITSWAGAYYGGELRNGAVYRVDTDDLSISGSVDVGYQPEGIAAVDGKIYVANSGGVTDGYDNRLSIIDEKSFTLERNVEIAVNICDIVSDGNGRLWISSPGDYYSVHSGIHIFDTATGSILAPPDWLDDVRVSSICSSGSHIWVIGNENEWDYTPGSGRYIIYNIDTEEMSIARTELAETGAAAAEVPYGIWVSADGNSIFISDSGDYINPGTMFALDRELSLTGRFSAGVNPGHFAFLSM